MRFSWRRRSAGDLDAHLAGARLHPPDIRIQGEIRYTIFNLQNPERLVLDLQTSDFPPALAELNGKVTAEDPYIQGLRGRNRPGVVRRPGLKAQVKPQIFNLPPIADYGHRLVLDIHPLVAVDPVAILSRNRKNVRNRARSEASRVSPPS